MSFLGKTGLAVKPLPNAFITPSSHPSSTELLSRIEYWKKQDLKDKTPCALQPSNILPCSVIFLPQAKTWRLINLYLSDILPGKKLSLKALSVVYWSNLVQLFCVVLFCELYVLVFHHYLIASQCHAINAAFICLCGKCDAWTFKSTVWEKRTVVTCSLGNVRLLSLSQHLQNTAC